jgi:DnaJ like chaperone protein
MTIWERIAEAIAALRAGESLTAVLEKLRTPPERSVAFTIAVIALGAKMAKADGRVTKDEVAAFREVFQIPKSEEANTARLYNLARQDVAGFEGYAKRVAAMFNSVEGTLTDLIEALFYIAVADGNYHPQEDDYLARVAAIFGLTDRQFRSIRTRFVPDAEPDPWDVLGVEPGTPLDEVRANWRALVRETHPDRMMARGVPEEAVKLAERRLIAINRAWEAISEGRA